MTAYHGGALLPPMRIPPLENDAAARIGHGAGVNMIRTRGNVVGEQGNMIYRAVRVLQGL